MKTFKLLDYWISIILIITSLIYGLLAKDFHFIYGYFVVGGWQIISILIHAWNRWFTNKQTGRYVYHCIVAIVIGAALIGLLIPLLLLAVLYLLLFTAPFMALFYTWLCYREVYVKMQRPLAMLK